MSILRVYVTAFNVLLALFLFVRTLKYLFEWLKSQDKNPDIVWANIQVNILYSIICRLDFVGYVVIPGNTVFLKGRSYKRRFH